MKILDQWTHVNFAGSSEAKLNQNYMRFESALKLLLDGKDDQAIELLKEIYISDEESLKQSTANLLFDLWFSQSKWDAIKKYGFIENEMIEKDNRLIAAASGQFAPRAITFGINEFSIPMNLSSTGSPIIEVSVNGNKKEFWLDTGAGMTVISSSFAEACQLSHSQIAFEIGASTDENYSSTLACIEKLDIGNVSIQNQPSLVLDDELLIIQHPVTQSIIKIDGIIGWDIIKDLTLELDYKNRILTAKEPKSISNSNPNLIFCGYPIVKLTSANMEPLIFGIDTGAQHTHFGESLTQKMLGLKTVKKKLHAGGVGGFKEVEVDQLEHLLLYLDNHPLEVSHIRKVLVDYATFFKLDGVLGSDCFQEQRLMLDYPNRKLEIHSSE